MWYTWLGGDNIAKKLGFNEYEIDGNIAKIKIVNRKNEKFFTIVDADDIPRLKELGYRWHVTWMKNVDGYYAQTTINLGKIDGFYRSNTMYLHSVISNKRKEEVVDHVNHDTLDNRKENLRITTNSKNLKHRGRLNKNNTSGSRNVSSDGKVWMVQLQIDGKNKVLGKFELEDLEKAIEFSNEMREKYYKEYKGIE